MSAEVKESARPAEAPPASWGLRRGDDIDPTLVVIEPLGGGSRYEVLAAWDRQLFCKAAVKLLRPDRVDSERSLASFEREAMMVDGLRHPNLVRLLRWSPALPRPYIVLEHIGAPTLSDLLEEVGSISVPEILLLAIRMLSALHYLHGRSLLHLDVKPSNITTGDPPRLLDLSIARFAPGPVKLRYAIGTAAYMPPSSACAVTSLRRRTSSGSGRRSTRRSPACGRSPRATTRRRTAKPGTRSWSRSPFRRATWSRRCRRSWRSS